MSGLRLAWVGPAPSLESGVSYMSTQLLLGLSNAGIEVDCFLEIPPSHVPPALLGAPGLRFLSARRSGWEWSRWYSSTPLTAFVSGQTSRALTQRRLLDLVLQEHGRRPYDFLYRFSQIELFGAGRHLADLPPIVVHPEVHAAGELHWHRREHSLARACEPAYRYLVVEAMLAVRSVRQRRDIGHAALVVAISPQFAAHLARDYRIAPERFRVAPNAVDLERFRPDDSGATLPRPLRLVFVSRLAVRKGVEMVVELSHRLADLAGEVAIEVAGCRSQWSDYTCLMKRANPQVLRFVGEVKAAEVPAFYQGAAAALQPSHYEPFALTVAEALACGVPAVVSDEVGAGHDVDRRCCLSFAHDDMDGFEACVRQLIATGAVFDPEVRKLARAEAERLFSPSVVGYQIAGYLEELATRTAQ